MAALTSSLTKLLKEQAAAQNEQALRQDARQGQFETEVREALVRIETKRSLDLTSPRGGLDYEDAVVSLISAATQGAPCVFDVTAATAGVGRCKKGDAVLRSRATAFAGAGVVFEAKRESGYTTQKALDELDAARKNRDAISGVFVMAASHANDAFPRLARYGNNVLVIWDDADPRTDAYLRAAVLLGMALVARTQTAGSGGDITALRDVETRIESEISRLERMEKHSDAIRKHVDGLSDEIRKGRNALSI
jgi:hypothetical protein